MQALVFDREIVKQASVGRAVDKDKAVRAHIEGNSQQLKLWVARAIYNKMLDNPSLWQRIRMWVAGEAWWHIECVDNATQWLQFNEVFVEMNG